MAVMEDWRYYLFGWELNLCAQHMYDSMYKVWCQRYLNVSIWLKDRVEVPVG